MIVKFDKVNNKPKRKLEFFMVSLSMFSSVITNINDQKIFTQVNEIG